MKISIKMIMNIILISLAAIAMMAAPGCGNSGNGSGPDPGPEPDPDPAGKAAVYVTNNNRAYDFTRYSVDFSTTANLSPTTITLVPETRYQTMYGFGAAVTGSTCYNLLRMSEANRRTFLEETFSPETGMGYSYIRISIGASDFSLSEYTCCDTPGIENFAFTSEETNYIIPILEEILEINPDIYIMGSPWTCPRWMKVDDLVNLRSYNSWTGGRLNPLYYNDYAMYFERWIETMESYGIPIASITPQNEPLNSGNSVSLFMGWEEQRDFIREALGPTLRVAGLDTKIYVFDHNYNYDGMSDQTDYPIRIYSDPSAGDYVAGAAYHNYGGSNTELDDIHNQRPDKELVFTETSIGMWNDGRNLQSRLLDDMKEVALGTVNRWCAAVMVWNLMLDSNMGPNRDGGCQTCYGAVDISTSDYATVTRNSHYYIIGHLAAVVKPGATRIGTTGYTDSAITTSAYENADGSYALVLMNENAESKQITVSGGGTHFSYTVPARSVVSYRWTPE